MAIRLVRLDLGAGALRPLSFMTQYVYAISAVHNALTVKIGVTENWQNRRRQLKVGQQAKEEALITCDNMRLVERELHDHFAEYRLPQSEWFIFPDKGFKAKAIVLLESRGIPLQVSSQPVKKAAAKRKKPTIKDILKDPSRNKYHEFWDEFRCFTEDWHEDFLEMSFSNPWVTQYWPAEWCDEHWTMTLEYLTPNGSTEEFQFFLHEQGKIHVNVENFDHKCTCWYQDSFDYRNFDIPTSDSSLFDELVVEYICKPLNLLKDLPFDTWPVQARANKLRLEQNRFLVEKIYGPELTDEEVEQEIAKAYALRKARLQVQ